MSMADLAFVNACKKIITEGFSDEAFEVRPKWEDGTPAHTKYLSPIVNTYDLRKEFPIQTLRRIYWKSSLDEILWIYQKQSNKVSELSSHVWDAWADEEGTIGKAYGWQIGQMSVYPEVTVDGIKKAFPDAVIADGCAVDHGKKIAVLNNNGKFSGVWEMDQMSKVIYDLVNNPMSRRIMTTTYVHKDLAEMGLAPCAYSTTWTVAGEHLNVILNQRSQDMLAAGGWNVTQYALLLTMVAQVTGYKPGTLTHVIANCHIYDRHIPVVEELIKQPTFEAPKLIVNEEVNDFYAFTKADFTMEGYQYNEFNHAIPVAV